MGMHYDAHHDGLLSWIGDALDCLVVGPLEWIGWQWNDFVGTPAKRLVNLFRRTPR